MTVEEFYQIDRDLQASGEHNNEYLISKCIKLHKY